MDIVKPFIESILYPVMEKRKGNKIRSNTRELQNSQAFSRKSQLQIQEVKLKKLLLECIKNVPAYQPYASLEDEINQNVFSALLKFPVLDKVTFRKDAETYLNQTVEKDALIANRTGGSTSEPVKFYMDRHTVEYYEAARWRGLSWWGITPGSRSVMIWGSPIELDQAAHKKYEFKEKWLKNRIIISAYSLKPESMPEYVERISSYRPEYFYGYPSALYAFSTLMIQQGLQLPFIPKAVVSTAETLFDFQRETIAKAFRCPVVNEYGARDAGILAYQCPDGSMHISSENVYIEAVDPKTLQPVPLGTSGLLLVTDLNNFAMPRLRYQLGDRGALSSEECKCGMGLPLMEKLDGREDDMFVTLDGRLVHGHVFNHVSRGLDAIKKFQLVQLSPSHAELKIIPSPNADPKRIEQFIAEVGDLLPGAQIDAMQVEDIPAGPSGKFRYAIRKFDL